jgi:hypothetical protein
MIPVLGSEGGVSGNHPAILTSPRQVTVLDDGPPPRAAPATTPPGARRCCSVRAENAGMIPVSAAAADYGGYAVSFPVPQLTGRAHIVSGPDRCSRPDRGTAA